MVFQLQNLFPHDEVPTLSHFIAFHVPRVREFYCQDTLNQVWTTATVYSLYIPHLLQMNFLNFSFRSVAVDESAVDKVSEKSSDDEDEDEDDSHPKFTVGNQM
jgi:hypothetical protein